MPPLQVVYMKKRIIFIAVAVVVLAAALAGVLLTPQPQAYTGFAMGSVLTQTYWGKTPAIHVSAAIGELEKNLLRIDERAPLLALEVMEASGGAYNPYLGALTRLWNINDEPYVPTPLEVAQALEEREVDLGAYGKGAACDEILNIVTRFGFGFATRAAVINMGGNILTYGQKPWNQPFKIALRDPLGGPNDTVGVFTLRGTHFISTSGSYEKYFEQDGKRYHHIFDPETGYPACRDPGLVSVTVINDNGALGDMISTACFVLGYEASLELLVQYNCDALFFYEDGDVRPVGRVMEYYEAR